MEEGEIALLRTVQELKLDKKQLETKLKHVSLEKSKLLDEESQSES